MIADYLLPPSVDPNRIVARLGLISDTHMPERLAELPPALFDVLRGVDLLLHGGDVGELWVLDRLSKIAPVVAVHGNDDTADAQRELPYQQIVAVAGQRILLSHCHYPDRAMELASRKDDGWAPKLARREEMARRAGASTIVFGHTHVPMTRMHGGVLLVNPGAIASSGPVARQRIQTVAVLYVLRDAEPIVVHVDLAAPEQPFYPDLDWEAGFRAALDRFSASILAPDLEPSWTAFSTLARSIAPDSCREAVLRVAHRCWSGKQPAIGREDLAAELARDPTISATVRERLLASLATKV